MSPDDAGPPPDAEPTPHDAPTPADLPTESTPPRGRSDVRSRPTGGPFQPGAPIVGPARPVEGGSVGPWGAVVPGVVTSRPIGVPRPSLAPAPLPPEQQVRTKYPSYARTPMWEAGAFVILLVLTFIVFFAGFAIVDKDDPDAPVGKGWVVAIVMVGGLTAFTALAWVRRIGINGRQFGWGLVVIAMVPWETLPLRLARRDDGSDLKIFLIMLAMLMTLAAGVLVRRTLALAIWRAGDLSAPVFAKIQWIFSLVSTELFLLAVLIVLAGEKKERFVSGYYTYQRTTYPNFNGGLVAVAFIGGLISAVIGLVALISATFSQHFGIRDDKRLLAAAVARGHARPRP